MAGEDRRILIHNQNLVNVLNNFTGTETIDQAKVEGLEDLAAAIGELSVDDGGSVTIIRHRAGYGAAVSAVYGLSVTFSSAYSTVLNAEGDYYAEARGWYGGTRVNVRVVKSPGGMMLYPDYDGANVEWVVFPYYNP